MKIVIAGFGSIGAFLYYLLKSKGYGVSVFSNRNKLQPFSVIFLNKNRQIYSYSIDNIELLDSNNSRIDYLFLATKAFDARKYLENISRNFDIDNVILTQNGIGLEDEIRQVFPGKIYYLTFTTGLTRESNKLIVYNSYKSQSVLSFVGNKQDENLSNFGLDLNNKFCVFSYGFNHLSLRFSKLILNLILNVVPAAFGGVAWDVLPNNQEAIVLEKKMIDEIISFMKFKGLGFFNFRGYNTSFIANFYHYCPDSVFKIIYSNSRLLRKLRDGRIPSFYKDLFLEKKRTEVEYYLGWYKKFPEFRFKAIEEIYNKIKKIEDLGYKEVIRKENVIR